MEELGTSEISLRRKTKNALKTKKTSEKLTVRRARVDHKLVDQLPVLCGRHRIKAVLLGVATELAKLALASQRKCPRTVTWGRVRRAPRLAVSFFTLELAGVEVRVGAECLDVTDAFDGNLDVVQPRRDVALKLQVTIGELHRVCVKSLGIAGDDVRSVCPLLIQDDVQTVLPVVGRGHDGRNTTSPRDNAIHWIAWEWIRRIPTCSCNKSHLSIISGS